MIFYRVKKSDNSAKISYFKTTKIGLAGSLGLYNKKAPQRVHF